MLVNGSISPRFFTLDYRERAVLPDGTVVRLRLVRPDDKATLRAGFERWSPASRYARFLAPKQSLSDDELRYLCDVDHEDHLAIGAERDTDADELGIADELGRANEPPRGLAIARFIRLADHPDTAEAAIAVADEAQNRGLGKLLFLRLVAAAAERGIARFRCEVLASNAGMVALLAQIAPDCALDAGNGVLSIEVALPSVAPNEPPHGAPVHSPMYRLFRAAAANAVEWTEAVRRLWRR